MSRMRPLLLAFASYVVLPALMLAQSDRGTITGRVIDATEAAVANATVTITNQETGIRTVSRTSETGNYAVPQLAVGKYEIAIEAQGFRRYLRRDVELNIAQTLTLN